MKKRYILAEFRASSASKHITVLPSYQAPSSLEESRILPSGCLDGHYVCWCSPRPVSILTPELQPLLRLLGKLKSS